MLITLEGLDGCGKTTACRALDEAFPDAVLTREPTDSWYGEAVRQSISRDGADPLAELFLYTADHAAHLQRIVRPALASDQLVISDRYADSRYAYQGTTLADRFDDPMGFVRSIHEPWSRTPDHTIFLEVPPAVGAARSGSTNKFERESFLERVDANYRQLIEAEPERFTVINADRAEATVRDTVVSTVETLIEENS